MMDAGGGEAREHDGDVDVEHRARVWELAQQQMEALQRLDEVVENQRTILERTRNNNEQRPLEEEEDEGEGHPDDDVHHREPLQPQEHQQRTALNRGTQQATISHMYLLLSAFLAFLAVFTSPSNVLFESTRVNVRPQVTPPSSSDMADAKEARAVDAPKSKMQKVEETSLAMDAYGNFVDRMFRNKAAGWDAVVAYSKATQSSLAEHQRQKEVDTTPPPKALPSSWTEAMANIVGDMHKRFIEPHNQHHSHQPATEAVAEQPPTSAQRWLPPWEWKNHKHGKDGHREADDSSNQTPKEKQRASKPNGYSHVKLHSILASVVGPPLFPPQPSSNSSGTILPPATNTTNDRGYNAFLSVIDNIVTSTPRLIAVANLLLAVTYLLQTAIADLFLGPINVAASARDNNPGNPTTGAPVNNVPLDPASRRRRAGRERFGGFLLFKLLLISAVLEPDSVDLFILLSWYTLLSFLRSLAHLAGTTTRHVSQSGEPPSPGALRLLFLVLACDALAAVGCVAVLSATGLNIILLLTCDCLLLGIDAVTNILRHVSATREEAYRTEIAHLEERQVELHARRGSGGERGADGPNGDLFQDQEDSPEQNFVDDIREIDRAMAFGETGHTRRMATMDTLVFSLEMTHLLVTIGHFIHIWALHGTSFGLVDGVLALHLHSTISMVGRKVSERRNAHRVARELNSVFPDASDLDLRKSSGAGDVCCICLNSMMVGNVKKVGCGHLFHATCLREVVERERSISLAKCPLCRASLVTGRHDSESFHPQVRNIEANTNNTDARALIGTAGDNRQGQPIQPANPQLNPGEQSLLRFSTENLLPTWLRGRVPAFAFEVVRRENTVVEQNPNPGGWQRFFRRGGDVQVMAADDDNGGNNEENEDQQPREEEEQQGETSFWRRLGILLGVVQMTPEEEAVALEQLVEMFPQYDRADLLRELRARRSAEAVAEAIILGIFSGIPRGGED